MSRPERGDRLPVHAEALAATDDQYDVLARWVAEVGTPADSLLDIGAGDGDDAYLERIRPLVGRVVGIDPEPSGAANTRLDEWHQTTVEAYAADLAGEGAGSDERGGSSSGRPGFDLALAIYVVEHVTEPRAFFRAARACLRPGGSLFIVTPNLWHYFGVAAKAAMALGVEDRLLGALRARHPEHQHAGQHEHQHRNAAHFPVAYRANSVRALASVGREAGFSALEIRHLENPAIFETYFPGRSVAFPRWYSRTMHRIGRPELFGTLICRFVN